jgi:hypothetical protein
MISVGSGTCIFLEENQLQADRQANVASTKTLNRYSLGLATKASAYHAGPLAAAFPAETLCLQNGTDSLKRRQRNRLATTRSNAFEMSIF